MNETYSPQSTSRPIPINQLEVGNVYSFNTQFYTDYLSDSPPTKNPVEITRIKSGLLNRSAVLCLQPLNELLETVDQNGVPIDTFTGKFSRYGFYLPKGLGVRRIRYIHEDGVEIKDPLRSAWLTESDNPLVLLQPGFRVLEPTN